MDELITIIQKLLNILNSNVAHLLFTIGGMLNEITKTFEKY